MQPKQLQENIHQLVTLEPTEVPVPSCYLNLSTDEPFIRTKFMMRSAEMRLSINDEIEREAFDQSVARVQDFLFEEIQPDTRGAAIFVRGGRAPFHLIMQFTVELPTWITMGPMPNVYHLVELKDSYHRFVILLALERSAKIIEVNLGKVTEEHWTRQLDNRDRLLAGVSKAHFQHYRDLQTDHFIKEKIKVLDRLIGAGGHTHLILAGVPRFIARVREHLPKHLAAKVVETIEADRRETLSAVVTDTIEAFLKQEERESQAIVGHLVTALCTSGLAAVGTEQCMKALEWGQADVLVMTKDYDPEHRSKEILVRMAETSGCQVEIVNESPTMTQLGGVGCLLRYANY